MAISPQKRAVVVVCLDEAVSNHQPFAALLVWESAGETEVDRQSGRRQEIEKPELWLSIREESS